MDYQRVIFETDSQFWCFGKEEAAMCKCASVVCFLIVSISLSAQTSPSARAVRINRLAISGASHVSATDMAAIEAEIVQACCDHAETQEIRQRILYAFQERGYFEARISQLDVTPVDTHLAPPSLDVSASVSEGQQFRLRAIQFNGNQALSSEQLRKQFRIRDGETFNTDEIRQGLEGLRREYMSQGFINFTPVPNTDADEQSGTITLIIDVDEGKQFRLGGLLLDGEEPHAGDGAKLREAWKPMEGKVYDGNKIEKWWQLAATMLPPGAKLEQLLELKQDGTTAIVTARLNFPSTD